MPFQKTISKTGHFTLYTSGSLVIMDFAQQSNAADFNEMTAMMKALAAKVGKISSISIAPPKVEKFDDATRAAMKDQQVQTAGLILGTAVVIPGGSLSALVVRTIVSGVNALSKSATPTKTFGDLKEALAWLQTVPGQTADVKALKPADLPSLGAAAKAA
ncbi:MAG: hypothetical protein ACOZQL_04840 [Myxococcota bacterium]